MRRKRLLCLAVACSLGLCAGCQSSGDRPSFFSRLTSHNRAEAPCCETSQGQVIYDGPPLPEGGPFIAPTNQPPNMVPLPSPTPIQPQAAAIPNGNGRLVPQSQPMPYMPGR